MSTDPTKYRDEEINNIHKYTKSGFEISIFYSIRK